MSTTIVVCILYEASNLSHISHTVKSILDGKILPSDIIIADSQHLPASLKKKDRVSVIKSENYGVLSSLIAAIKKHGTAENVKYIIVDDHVTYMPHLIQEYLSSSLELENLLILKLKDTEKVFKGSVFGLSGIVFIENKQENLENELKSLLCNEQEEKFLTRTQPACLKDNSTVDVLEIYGSIYFTGDQISGFVEELEKKEFNKVTAAVHLSNYFSKKGIYKTQICNLVNNKYIMEKIDCFLKLTKLNINDYFTVLNNLNKLNNFYLW